MASDWEWMLETSLWAEVWVYGNESLQGWPKMEGLKYQLG